jgi:hypothetical protein
MATKAKLRLGPNFAIFVLFFGVAMLDAFSSRDFLRAAFWVAIACVFLFADRWHKTA